MADQPSLPPKTNNREAPPAQPMPPTEVAELLPKAEKAVEKLERPEILSLAAILSKTTVGPDPESAKIMAQTEMHAEDSRLAGYKATLVNRDEQSKRDHEYRLKRLNHESSIVKIVLGVAVLGASFGIYFIISDRAATGGQILIASFMTIIYLLGGKTPFLKEK